MYPSRNVALDLVRSVAALEVLLTHLQLFIFKDLEALPDPGFVLRGFYVLTSLGHQSVIVFFVLSGYLVGGSVINGRREGFWLRYATQRLCRLWIVLIPCLVATLVLNRLGQFTGGSVYLNGGLNPPIGSAPLLPVRLDLLTFLENCVFLQTIRAPIFGDNGPLWSLANEFWYYVIFPFLFFGVSWNVNRPFVTRVAFLAVAGAVLFFLPARMAQGFGIWLLGALVTVVQQRSEFELLSRRWFGVAACIFFLFLLIFSRLEKLHDSLLGLSFAATLPFLLTLRAPAKWLGCFAAWMSDFSYTLYLAHFPFAAYLWYTYFHTERLTPSLSSVARFGVTAVVVVGYSFTMSVVFERNTDRCRKLILSLVKKFTPSSAKPVVA